MQSIMQGAADVAAEVRPNTNWLYQGVKRTMDVVIAAVALVIASPILLIAAIAIKVEDPHGAVLYHQARIGRGGERFMCHKLRSMYVDADQRKASLMQRNEMDGPVFKIRNDPRVTRVGHFLRKTSIDELPQLYNVLKGEMSLVGPRPLPVKEALGCSAYQRQRELVRPGLTCYWQISGRNDVSFKEWMEWDLKYIREQNLWIDLKILARTIPAVLSMRGGY